MADLAKQLRIKTGVCKRVVKDLTFYNKEKVQQEGKIQKLVDDSAPEDEEAKARIKQQRDVLEETLAMIPDTKTRIDNAYDDLKSFVAQNGDSDDIAGTELLDAAQKVLQDVESAFYSDDTKDKANDGEEEEY